MRLDSASWTHHVEMLAAYTRMICLALTDNCVENFPYFSIFCYCHIKTFNPTDMHLKPNASYKIKDSSPFSVNFSERPEKSLNYELYFDTFQIHCFPILLSHLAHNQPKGIHYIVVKIKK